MSPKQSQKRREVERRKQTVLVRALSKFGSYMTEVTLEKCSLSL